MNCGCGFQPGNNRFPTSNGMDWPRYTHQMLPHLAYNNNNNNNVNNNNNNNNTSNNNINHNSHNHMSSLPEPQPFQSAKIPNQSSSSSSSSSPSSLLLPPNAIAQRTCTCCKTNNRSNTSGGQNFWRFNESTQGAFSTIEAIVTAANSIAGMLNAIHYGIHSSFQAIADVLDKVTSLEQQINSLMASVALLNWLRYIWRLLINCLKLRRTDDNDGMEEVWLRIRKASGSFATQQPLSQFFPSNSFSWLSSLIFWLLTIGLPYLMYRSLRKMKAHMNEPIKWTTGQGTHYEALATDYHEAQATDQISFRCNDILHVAPREYQPQVRGYVLASTKNGKEVGLVPISKIRLLRKTAGTPPALTDAPENYLSD